MSKVRATKLPPVVEQEKPHLALVEAPSEEHTASLEETAAARPAEPLEAEPAHLIVYVDSLGVSMLDRFSLVRVFREEWRNQVAYYRSEKGGNLPLDQAVERATHKVDEKGAAELFERVLTQSAEVTDFDDLHKMWMHSPEDAEFVWQQMKIEAQREFMTGHLAATVFEPVDWMRSAWKRAKFLGVRDTFIDEYEPEGGVEIALVDTMAQAYFLQLHWTEESVRRTNADPRRHSYEYEKWEQYKRSAAKAQMWESSGYWEIPYASELECQEQAVKMADHFSRLFQRTVRALDNHRLAKAKLKRLSLPAVRRSIVEREHEHTKEWKNKLDEAKRLKG
ncbi:MAG TPA: hypothetical protein VM864_06190 [Pyrinomonadaceae bacterium]|jgi:hypothetical protein|nr:hypothetical protein [Pyrinomonadaceae bacterium]